MATGAISIEVQGLAEMRQALAVMAPEVNLSLDRALQDSSRIVADRVRASAPTRTGALRGSVRPFTEGGTVGGVRVTAKRISRRWPGGYGYPRRIEFQGRPFVRPAVVQTKGLVIARMEKALDEMTRAWGG